MARYNLDTRDRDNVRRVRRLVRRWFGPDAEMVFGEAADNVLEHSEHQRALVSLHARGFHLTCHGASIPSDGLSKFITNKDRQGGYGLLLVSALGGDLHLTDDSSTVRWSKEDRDSPLALAVE